MTMKITYVVDKVILINNIHKSTNKFEKNPEAKPIFKLDLSSGYLKKIKNLCPSPITKLTQTLYLVVRESLFIGRLSVGFIDE